MGDGTEVEDSGDGGGGGESAEQAEVQRVTAQMCSAAIRDAAHAPPSEKCAAVVDGHLPKA